MTDELLEGLDSLLKDLFPLSRSLSGRDNRITLEKISKIIPLKICEVPSGTEVYDWSIPKEWNVVDAWVKNEKGEKIIDFKKCNIHLVSYSAPINKKVTKEELCNHLYFDQSLPEAIPYRTTYYKENWGFCLSYKDFQKKVEQEEGAFEVFIDSTIKQGSMSYGEILIEGKTPKEILLSCYICHPSMANDSLSGVVVATYLAKYLMSQKENLLHSYRVIFVPETVGAIAYCALNEEKMKKIKRGFVLTTCGGKGPFGYKKSWDEEDYINTAVEKIFNATNISYQVYPFDINGSDERQYSSQGFRINCITITKDKYYEYPEYHTSLDNLDFVKAEALLETFNLYKALVWEIDKDVILKNKKPNCEIRLGKYGELASSLGGAYRPGEKRSDRELVMWLMFHCDGKKALSKISEILQVDLKEIYKVAEKLIKENVLEIEVN